MSRIITFRAWDRKHNRFLIPGDLRVKTLWDLLDFSEYEWMQYTGLKDKNGKEIYEGDLLQTENKIGEVKWDKLECRFRVYFTATGHSVAHTYPVCEFHAYQIIGNIYENPGSLVPPIEEEKEK